MGVQQMTYGKDVQQELRPHARELRRMIPDVYKAFGALHSAALTDGALDAKTKELMAFAISVSKQCDGCIAAHARGAAMQGATLEEAAEAIGVAVLMNGGPATVYGPRALSSFAEFHADVHASGAAAPN
ncbi:MAG: carboxymuconolactone decarboxylase family protein [Candidatus Nanopelagicales bacterium]